LVVKDMMEITLKKTKKKQVQQGIELRPLEFQ